MTDTSERRWFQFHLSTVMMFMLFSAGLIVANCTYFDFESQPFDTHSDGGIEVDRFEGYGWPTTFLTRQSGFTNNGKWYAIYDTPLQFSLTSAGICLLSAFSILVATTLFCEWSVRRCDTMTDSRPIKDTHMTNSSGHHIGHFRTPLAAAMLVGTIGAAIWFVPLIRNIDPYSEFWKCAPYAFACSVVLCSGRAIQERRASYLLPALYWGTFVTAADMSLPIIVNLRPMEYWRFVYPNLNACHSAATVISGALMGAAIGTVYPTKMFYSICLGILGEGIFLAWPLVEALPGKDTYALWVTIMILGNIAMPVIPTIIAEKAFLKPHAQVPQ